MIRPQEWTSADPFILLMDDRADGLLEPTALEFANEGERPSRVLLYTGQRQDISISWYGPFIGDTQQDIVRSFERYRAGTFQRV